MDLHTHCNASRALVCSQLHTRRGGSAQKWPPPLFCGVGSSLGFLWTRRRSWASCCPSGILWQLTPLTIFLRSVDDGPEIDRDGPEKHTSGWWLLPYEILPEFRFLPHFSQVLSDNINIKMNTMQLIYYLSGITQKCKGRVPFKNHSEDEEKIYV